MTNVRTTETHRIVAEMLGENTGRHFLDSGGAYGRSWERNRAKLAVAEATGFFPPEVPTKDHAAYAWHSEPRASWGYSGEWISLSVFHFLTERLTYLPKLDRLFRSWCEMDGTDRYDSDRRYYNSSATVDDFVTLLEARGFFSTDGEWRISGYTYNEENNLSQDVVYTVRQVGDLPEWREELYGISEGDFVVGVSIHGGCDARGGFTDTRWFTVDGGWDGVAGFFDYADAEVWCENIDTLKRPGQLHLNGKESEETVCDAAYDLRHGDIFDREGCSVDANTEDLWTFDDETSKVVCARCGGEMMCDAPYVG